MGRRGERPEDPHGLLALADSQDRKAGRAIELFHFALLEIAAAQLRPEELALKGGGNLRMFLGSKRRSRDLDLDFLGGDFGRFGDRVSAILKSRELVSRLADRDIRMVHVRLAKNTDVSKRWKLFLAASGMEDAATKVEFSGRPTDAVAVLELCDATLAAVLGVSPVLLNHYPAKHAIEQKVGALAERNETQPRDVFDLDHLVRTYSAAFAEASITSGVLRESLRRVREITYAEYQLLVVDYLDEDIAIRLGTEDAWETIRLNVATKLEERLK